MIPIFRAKKKDSDEYVDGYFWKENDNYCIDSILDDAMIDIDPSTLSISFDNSKSFIKLSDLEIHTCTDFELKYTDLKKRAKKEKQPRIGKIFTIITEKGRD